MFKIIWSVSDRVGSILRFSNLPGGVREGQFFFEYYGSGRVGSGQDFSNLAGWVGSGQEVMKNSRVGSDHEPRETGHSRVGPA